MNTSSLSDYCAALVQKSRGAPLADIQPIVMMFDEWASVPPMKRDDAGARYVQAWRDFLLGDAPGAPECSACLDISGMDIPRIELTEARLWLNQCKANDCSVDDTPDDRMRPFAWLYLNFGLRLVGLQDGQDYFSARKRAHDLSEELAGVVGAAAPAAPVTRRRL